MEMEFGFLGDVEDYGYYEELLGEFGEYFFFEYFLEFDSFFEGGFLGWLKLGVGVFDFLFLV